jgi:hypothetical protein
MYRTTKILLHESVGSNSEDRTKEQKIDAMRYSEKNAGLDEEKCACFG